MFTQHGILILMISLVILLVMFCGFITTIVYRYTQRQAIHLIELEALKADHGNALLTAQLEMQEQTFQNISREIHDNIGQKLTLAKLYLNTLGYLNTGETVAQVNSSILKISEAINDLSDISRSMSSEIITGNGLLKGIEFEVAQLRKCDIYEINVSTTGSPVFLESKKELILFRIIQESIHNIIKHAEASVICIHLHFSEMMLSMIIKDNGKGFEKTEIKGIGLVNITKRISLLKGNFSVDTNKKGTRLLIEIPIN